MCIYTVSACMPMWGMPVIMVMVHTLTKFHKKEMCIKINDVFNFDD